MKKIGLGVVLVLMSLMLFACKKPTKPEPVKDLSNYNFIYGYANQVVNDRSKYKQGYEVVSNEIEFLEVLIKNETKIIEVTRDLNLGFLEVKKQFLEQGKNIDDMLAVYRQHNNLPTSHPKLLMTGVGQILINGRSDLMIFSKKGVKINHVAFRIEESTNLIFRNLEFDELWEWDDTGRGQFKDLDWDYFGLEKNVKGVWWDHVTFNQSYDGIIDVKSGCSDLTLSYANLNFVPNAFIQEQIDKLDSNKDSYPYYKELISKNTSKDDVLRYASYQKKGFNLGNTTNGAGFESITFTFHHVLSKNLQDRFVRLRKGDVHMYNVIHDAKDLNDLAKKVLENNSPLKLVNQGLVPTEQGAILLENSRFIEVNEPIKNNQETNSRDKEEYTGRYKVSNSELILNGKTYYNNCSDEETIWISNVVQAPILEFKLRNYDGQIPYQYKLDKLVDLDKVTKIDEVGTAPTLNDDFDWLYIADGKGKEVDKITNESENINAEKLSSVDFEIDAVNLKMTYYVGDEKDFNKLIVRAKMNDGSYRLVRGFIVETNCDMEQVGTYVITVKYKNFSDKSITVEVISKPTEQIGINTVEKLIEMVTSGVGNYELSSDIDMGGAILPDSFGKTIFDGTLDGKGYAIKNLHNKAKTNKTGLLFKTIYPNSVIKNLVMENCSFEGIGEGAGIIAYEISRGVTLENITFNNISIKNTAGDYTGILFGEVRDQGENLDINISNIILNNDAVIK